MKITGAVFTVFMLAALSGWAEGPEPNSGQSPIDWSSPKSIREHMVFKLAPVKGEQTLAPNVVLSDPALAENFSEIYLVRTENLDEGEYFTLHITASYQDTTWRNYNRAITVQGEELTMTSEGKTKHNCDNKELCQREEKLAITLGFIEIVDSMTTHLNLMLSGSTKKSLSNESGTNKTMSRTDHIIIPGSYFLAIMQTIKSE